jgi:DNA-binding response OmpR family regulator
MGTALPINMKRILLVEDEIGVVDFIKRGLTENDFAVSVALDGASAIDLAMQVQFDLMILDIMLPGKNGIEVCKTLRQRQVKIPILILTALGTAENVAHGLNIGADDYLVKPFKFIELHARVNALIRRTLANSGEKDEVGKNILMVADLTVDDDAKTVTRAGKAVLLTATEYRLLMALLRNKGRVLSRWELLSSVWEANSNVSANVVDVYINYLRKKIDVEHPCKLIHTVIGMGYILKDK